jgi:hypothetical protein
MRNTIICGVGGGVAWCLAALMWGKKDVSEALLGAVIFGSVFCLTGAMYHWKKARHTSNLSSNDTTDQR